MCLMRTILIFLSALFLLSCSKKNLSEVIVANSDFVMPQLMSTVNVHFKIDKEAINDTFNLIIDQYLDTDLAIDAMGMNVVVTKERDATMEFLGTKVLTTLPIKIDVSKETIFKNITGNGLLELNFITDIDIDSLWRLDTETEMASHQWLEKPKLNLGGLAINVSSLADAIINRSKATFEKQIDLSVAEQVSFKDRMLDIIKYVEEPILVDTILNSWLTVKPQNIYMSHIENAAEFSTGNLTIHGETALSSFRPDSSVVGLALPKFSWETNLDDTSHINMMMDISYDEINNYLIENFKGKTFKNGGKKVKIHDVHMKRSGDKLTVVSDVSGSVNGQLLVSGKPIFDNDNQVFYTEDIDIEIATNNIIHRAGAWLFKGKIKNQLKGMLRFSIADNLDQFQSRIDTQIEEYTVKDEVEFKADLRKLNINKFVLDNDRIHTFMTFNIFLETKIYNLGAFDNPTYFKLKN